jgi:hypothetical protein
MRFRSLEADQCSSLLALALSRAEETEGSTTIGTETEAEGSLTSPSSSTLVLGLMVRALRILAASDLKATLPSPSRVALAMPTRPSSEDRVTGQAHSLRGWRGSERAQSRADSPQTAQ